MPILIILTVAVQAFFIFHVIRTNRPYWWAFVILSFPLGGSLIYYLVEIFPNSRQHRSARKTVKNIVRSIQPDAELERRAEELEICGSMDNKLALARACTMRRIASTRAASMAPMSTTRNCCCYWPMCN